MNTSKFNLFHLLKYMLLSFSVIFLSESLFAQIAIIPETTLVSCNGGNNGAINIQVTGGTAPYTYQWSTVPASTYSATSENISGLTANTYHVEVTDDNLFTMGLDIIVHEPTSLSVDLTPHDPSCYNGTDGKIVPTVTGGTPSYSYSWTGSNSFASSLNVIENLTTGSYSVTVTDANGCTSQNNTSSLSQPSDILISLNTTSFGAYNVHCDPGNDGSINSTVTGGTTPYTYLWNNFEESANLSDLYPGNYKLRVTDANGCSKNSSSSNLTIESACQNQIIILPTITTFPGSYNISCYGASDGSIQTRVIGGTEPYTYTWSGPGGFHANAPSINGLPAGNYHLLVMDANLGVSQIDITLKQPKPLSIHSNVNQIICHGDANGQISVTVEGGTSPYSFDWSSEINNYSSQLQTIDHLIADTYHLLLMDENGCTNSIQANLVDPEPISILLTPSHYGNYNVTCAIGNDGFINSDVDEGTAPYKYMWSNTQNTPSISGLRAESYRLTVTDANKCSNDASITLTMEEPCTQPAGSWQTLGNVNTTPETHFVGTTDNKDLSFRTNNTEKVRILNMGNVGIGTSQPFKALHVFTEHQQQFIQVEPKRYNTPESGLKYPESEKQAELEQELKIVNRDPDAVAGFNGKVLIEENKFGPHSPISIPGYSVFTGINQGIRLENVETGVGTICNTCPGTVKSVWDIEPLVTNKGNMLGFSAVGAYASSRILMLNATQRVGINNDDPVETFQVNANRSVTIGNTSGNMKGEFIGFNSILTDGNGDGKFVKLGAVSPASIVQKGGAIIHTDYDGNLQFQTYNANTATQAQINWKPNVVFANNGNVGFGTSSPAGELHLKGKSSILDFILESGGGGIGRWDLVVGDDGVFKLFQSSTSLSRLLVTPDGKIGIGTDNPESSLDVRGKIKMCSGEVQVVSGCDFVFDSGYNLGSLKEREHFLLKNKHLPNIQPAKEMEQNGVDISNTMMGMLQNIEELNLFVIELNKKLDALKAENETLKKRK